MKTGTMLAIGGGVAAVAVVGAVLLSTSKAQAKTLPSDTEPEDDAPDEDAPDEGEDAGESEDEAPDEDAGDEGEAGGGGGGGAGEDSAPIAPAATTTVVVKSAQTTLNTLGAKPALKVDGLFGPKTTAAWQAAAKARKLNTLIAKATGDGKVARVDKNTAAAFKTAAAAKGAAKPVTNDAATKAAAKEKAAAEKAAREAAAADKKASAVVKKTPAKPTQPAKPKDTEVRLKVGVRTAQGLLNRLGAALKVDGLHGPKTEAAWNTAAKSRGLPVGFTRFDKETGLAAKAAYVRLSSDAIVADAENATGQKAKPATAAAKPKAEPETVVVTVLEAQRSVNRQGAALKEDGLYGPKTSAAWGQLAAKHGVSARFEKVDARNVRIDSQTAKTFDALLPDGFDRAKAKAQANDIAAMLRNQGKAYQAKRLVAWQRFAGLTPDGKYGPHTKAALEYFGAKPPAAFIAGSKTTYAPPG